MALLTNFGEQFASKVLAKTYQNAVVNAIANREYEGEIKRPGDRVNILSFLNDIVLSDYQVGSDMNSENIVDHEDQLVVEKRKYWNFALDRIENLFTYADNVVDNLVENGSKVLEREIDTYVLEKAAEAKAGSWIGVNVKVAGSVQTAASIVTTATGGTVTLMFSESVTAGNATGVEQDDGTIAFGGFESTDIGKGFRLRSSATFVTPWYRISSVTSSTVATLTEWDEETTGSDFAEGYTLRGVFGGDGVTFPKYGTGNANILSAPTQDGMGWEIQAAIATTASASQIYDQVTLLAEKLDENEVGMEDRHFTVTPQIVTQLKQSSELQPTGIAEIFTGTVINGRVMRVGAFDVHMAAGARVSTRAGHSTGSGDFTASQNGYLLLANHKGMITFADKWSESRVVDAENQFAKKYQGLFLYGAKVPNYRRKYGAVLFASV